MWIRGALGATGDVLNTNILGVIGLDSILIFNDVNWALGVLGVLGVACCTALSGEVSMGVTLRDGVFMFVWFIFSIVSRRVIYL